MLKKILVNVQKKSGECSRGFRGMLKEIQGAMFYKKGLLKKVGALNILIKFFVSLI